MGIFSDTYEDNAEREGRILSPTLSGSLPTTPYTPPPPPTVWHPCPACGSPFPSQASLAQHLRRECSGRHVYLRLNDQIVRDVAWVPEGIETLEVVSLGPVGAALELKIGGRLTKLAFTQRVAVESYIPPGFEGELSVRVSCSGRADIAFSVFAGREPRFSRAELDSVLLGFLREVDRSGGHPDVSRWRERCALAADDVLGARLLDGVFEYALAIHLENDGDSRSKEHFETALGCLLPYDLPLAVGIRSAIALKMNFFDLLRERTDSSPFAAAYEVFTGHPAASHQTGGSRNSEVVADTVTALLVAACVHISDADSGAAEGVVHQIESLPRSISRNDADKLSFIKGLLYPTLAPELFEELSGHPTLGSRVRELVKAMGLD